LKKYIKDYVFLFSIAGFVVLLDQLTKYLVRTNLAFSEAWSPWTWLMPYARIVNWQNTGAAFGILQQFGGVFTILAIIVSLGIIYYFPQVPRSDWLIRLALSLQLGGALGNFIDRVTRGYVTDFVSIGNFAVWNIADACISIGTVLLILGIWLNERKKEPVDPEIQVNQDGNTTGSTSNSGSED
jgi:signal peptidase II